MDKLSELNQVEYELKKKFKDRETDLDKLDLAERFKHFQTYLNKESLTLEILLSYSSISKLELDLINEIISKYNLVYNIKTTKILYGINELYVPTIIIY